MDAGAGERVRQGPVCPRELQLIHRLLFVLASPTSHPSFLPCCWPLPTSGTTSGPIVTHYGRLTSSHNHASSDPYNKCVMSLRVVLLL